MLRLPFEAFLAFRYLRPRRTFVSVITLISIVAVLLGVAVLIVVIAVMSGFDKEWRDSILGFKAHLTVYPTEGGDFTNYAAVMKAISTNPSVLGTSPLIESQILAETQPQEDAGKPLYSAPYVAGVDPATVGKVNVLPKSIIDGAFDVNDKGVLVGRGYAARNHLEVGEHIAVWTWRSLPQPGATNVKVPLGEDFTVHGIFDVGFPDFNEQFIGMSLDDLRELLGLPEKSVQFLQVKLRDPFLADDVADQVRAALPKMTVRTWQEDSPDIFNALATEKNMMFFLLFFIMIAAAFCIVSSQITFVVQKTREIGILKAVGATNPQILCLFLSQSVFVGVFGVGLGLVAGLLVLHYRNPLLSLMRYVTHSNILPSTIYHVYDLPASIQLQDVLVICGTAFGACVFAGLFPAWKASRLQPVEALRYE